MSSYAKIGAQNRLDVMVEEVIEFFNENDISMDRFFQMHENSRDTQGRHYNLETIVPLIKAKRYELFVSMMSWSDSIEGITYWSRLSDKWEDFFRDVMIEKYGDVMAGADMLEPMQIFFKKDGVVRPKPGA
jgi:hypothetical protein